MRRPVNPYRVVAHALDVGDRRLAALLLARLGRQPGPSVAAERDARDGCDRCRRAQAIDRLVRRLIAELELD
jgi:hypothetical protein